MCVLPDFIIAKYVVQVGMIEPYVPEQLNPASYDLTLGSEIIDLNTNERRNLGAEGHVCLYHGRAILATTREYVRIPPELVGSVALKSTMARSGLDHALAGWIDPGFEGRITLELHAHRDVMIHVGQRICQIVFQTMEAVPAKPYHMTGHYQGQTTVTPPYLDVLEH